MKKTFLTQPYLLSLHPDTEMSILWIQPEPFSGIVEYGNSPVPGQTITAACHALTGMRAPASAEGYSDIPEDNPPITLWQCIATITGLTPGEHIYYRCLANGESTPVYEFHTAPAAGEPYRFAQISDLQGLLPCEETVYQIGRKHPDFILFSGDAAYVSWRMDHWFDLDEPWQSKESARRAFFPCMQQENGARLMQYAPTFLCPGNHDMNDWRVDLDRELCVQDEIWNWSVYMQLFSPLYPDPDTSITGKRWYSANYSDMHIVSLSIQRCAMWSPYVKPGWRLMDSIAPDSPQIAWLTKDLADNTARYTWVIQHWHLLNKGSDVQPNLCDPVIAEDGTVSYPYDGCAFLMNLFEMGRVNAVSYGHSHVYERYFAKGTHYIEAAYLSCCYREQNAPFHPGGFIPVVEDNSRQSFLIAERNEQGLFGTGYYSDAEPIVFDKYQLADENGNPVAP